MMKGDWLRAPEGGTNEGNTAAWNEIFVQA